MRKVILAGRMFLSLTAAAFVLLFMSQISAAKATSSDAQLKMDIAAINGDTGVSHQKEVAADRIAKEFKVSTQDVTALRDKLPGMGEVAAVYAFADKMPGGVTPKNVDMVVSARQSKNKDWDEIAQAYNIKLSSISNKVHGIYKDVHKDIKKAEAGKAGAAAGGMKY